VRPVVPNKLDRGFPRAKVVGTSGMSQLPRPLRQPPASAELAAALGACRRAFLAIALFSGMSNILMLTGSLFMLEVYDRVIPSRSVPTLVALLILASGLYAAQGIIDAIRSRILVRVGNSLDETLSLRVYDAIVRLPLTLGVRSEGAQPIRDLDTVPASSPAPARSLCSTCLGCRSTSASAFCSIPISGLPQSAARSSSSR